MAEQSSPKSNLRNYNGRHFDSIQIEHDGDLIILKFIYSGSPDFSAVFTKQAFQKFVKTLNNY